MVISAKSLLLCALALYIFEDANCRVGIAEKFLFNTKINCMDSSKKIYTVQSEMQCFQQCVRRDNCEMLNYRTRNGGENVENNCEVYELPLHHSSCNTVPIWHWTAVFIKREETKAQAVPVHATNLTQANSEIALAATSSTKTTSATQNMSSVQATSSTQGTSSMQANFSTQGTSSTQQIHSTQSTPLSQGILSTQAINSTQATLSAQATLAAPTLSTQATLSTQVTSSAQTTTFTQPVTSTEATHSAVATSSTQATISAPTTSLTEATLSTQATIATQPTPSIQATNLTAGTASTQATSSTQVTNSTIVASSIQATSSTQATLSTQTISSIQAASSSPATSSFQPILSAQSTTSIQSTISTPATISTQTTLPTPTISTQATLPTPTISTPTTSSPQPIPSTQPTSSTQATVSTLAASNSIFSSNNTANSSNAFNASNTFNASRAYESCKEIYHLYPGINSGVFNLTSGRHYCMMDNIPNCGQGGWTLAMKIDGTKTTLKSTSTYWETNSVYNVDMGLNSSEKAEAKFAAYNQLSFNSVCIGMNLSATVNWLHIPLNASSLLDVIKNGNYIPTNLGRNAWKSMLPGSSLQLHCNREGFNIHKDTTMVLVARIGITGNDENSCAGQNSYLGFGTKFNNANDCGNPLPGVSCGNLAYCGSDNGDKSLAAFGYIYIK